MTNPIFLKYAFLVSFLIALTVPILKVLHVPSNGFLLAGFVVFTLVYAVIGIYEVYGAQKLTTAEKVMWTVGFMLLSTLTGFIYPVTGRTRIQRQYKFLRR